MTRYYIPAFNVRGFVETTEEEFNALRFEKELYLYVDKVYSQEMLLEETPEEMRERIEALVAKRIAENGAYETQTIPVNELTIMIEEAF